MKAWHNVVLELKELIKVNEWEDKFDEAISMAQKSNIDDLHDIQTLDAYLAWINDLLHWIPSEDKPGRLVYNKLCKFHYILDQPSLLALQNRVLPHENAAALKPLSAWMVRFADALGLFMDTPESLTVESLQSFNDSPTYNMSDYIVPHGGWKSFNQFFARNFKPGMRPVAAVADSNIIISPADSTFAGQWEIRRDSQITVKNLHWSVNELLEGSPYKDRFINGQFMHAFLSPTDYHRQHAPVGGTVLEARVIPGQVYFEVVAEPISGDAQGSHQLAAKRIFNGLDNTGYQFAQSRGLIVLDTAIGLIAILPIGMCQVSSVILTAEVGVTLRKGEEMSYFQFGGSDIVMLFEAKSNVCFNAQLGVHYKMGTKIAQAYPVV